MEHTRTRIYLKWALVALNVITIFNFSSPTLSGFYWGPPPPMDSVFWLLIALLVSTIMIIFNVFPGLYLNLTIALTYVSLFVKDFVEYLLSGLDREELVYFLLIPYLLFLFLIPLTGVNIWVRGKGISKN